MRATLTAIAILLLGATIPPGARAEALPPASVFDLDDLMRPAGETVIVSDEALDSTRVPGRKVRRIRIEFPSHVWGGEPIRIAATDPRVVGIVPMARSGHFTHLMRERYQGVIPAPVPEPDRKREREYMTTIDDMYSRRGYEYLAHADPYFFMSRVSVP